MMRTRPRCPNRTSRHERHLARGHAMLNDQEQLEIWWESLSPDQRAAVLAIDPEDDPPGWVVASLVAAHAFLDEDPTTEPAEDFKFRVPQALAEFVGRKRSEK